MDDASSSLPPQGGMPGSAGDTGAMPPMGEPAPEGDMPPMGNPEPEMDDITKGIVDTLSKMSDKGKKAVRSYAESYAESHEEGDEQPQEGAPAPGAAPAAPVQESVIFTKKQVRKINEGLENLDSELEKKTEKVGHSTKTKKTMSSPFDPPKTTK